MGLNQLVSSRPVLNRAVLVAMLDELKFWDQIMTDHAMLIRNEFDLAEEDFFRLADRFAVNLHALTQAVSAAPENASSPVIQRLIGRTADLVKDLRDFKTVLARQTERCRVHSQLPPLLIDHTRREADFFLSILSRVLGLPTATRDVVGIPDDRDPDSRGRLQSLPIRLIPAAPPLIQRAAALEEILFWSRIQAEHAQFLSTAFIPQIQESYIEVTRRSEQEFREHLALAAEVERTGGNVTALIADNVRISTPWRAFLVRLFNDLETCGIPGGHANFPPALIDHMRRELDYQLTALRQAAR